MVKRVKRFLTWKRTKEFLMMPPPISMDTGFIVLAVLVQLVFFVFWIGHEYSRETLMLYETFLLGSIVIGFTFEKLVGIRISLGPLTRIKPSLKTFKRIKSEIPKIIQWAGLAFIGSFLASILLGFFTKNTIQEILFYSFIVAPCEEAFFRYLIPIIFGTYLGWPAGSFLGNIIFSFMHYWRYGLTSTLISVFIGGICYSIAYTKSKSLLAPTIAHSLYDIIPTIYHIHTR